MGLEIIVTRSHDGRYIASVPGLHPGHRTIGYTAEAAVRLAQAAAFSYMADLIRANGKLPDTITEWFCARGHADGKDVVTQVGGRRRGTIPDTLLLHPDNNTIPARRLNKSMLPKLPNPGQASLSRPGQAIREAE